MVGLAAVLVFFPALALAAAPQTTEQYIADFYNRYSRHFDAAGLVYAVPDYGVEDFKQAETPRELMSLAAYYRFRAIAGEAKAQDIIARAVRQSDDLLSRKSPGSYSFEDANAQFLMWRMINDVPLNMMLSERWGYRQRIMERAENCLAAPDTENRAVLSSAYWQYLADQAANAGLIDSATKDKLDSRIKAKIDTALADSVDADGWYAEGSPKTFNPHYHLITAFYTMAYGELSDQPGYQALAGRMAADLRQLSFANGMVEAGLGPRPVGLGAQFYLGAGLLNWRSGMADYGTYLNYAAGGRFFSDPAWPDRLEYHATLAGKDPSYHDDYAFSNLAELAMSLYYFNHKTIVFSDSLKIPPTAKGISNDGSNIVYKDQRFSMRKNITSIERANAPRPLKLKTGLLDDVLQMKTAWQTKAAGYLQSNLPINILKLR